MFASHIYSNSGSVVEDPYFNNVSLLLHGDGTNGNNNKIFLDSSPNNFTITNIGNPTQGSFSPFNLNGVYSITTNGGSGYFNGTTDYLTIPDSAQFNLSSNNFTIECWVYFKSLSTQFYFGQIQDTETNRSFVHAVLNNKYYFEIRSGSTAYSIQSINNITLNEWTHIAAVRDGDTITLYRNGISIGSVSVSGVTVNNSSNLMGIGGAGGYNNNLLNGYISNVRIVNGTAVYTSQFTPPTSPLTAITNTSLLCNFTNAGIFDNAAKNNLVTVGGAAISTAQKKFGTGSMYFNQAGSYLTLPGSSNFDLGSQSFTIECWFNGSGGSYDGIFVRGTSNIGRYTLNISPYGHAEMWLNAYSISIPLCSGHKSISDDQWHHIALVRNGTFFTIYTDGVGGSTVSSAISIADSSEVASIGADIFNPTVRGILGYIDDFRITKGVARYTANFTPPTNAFPNL